MKRRVETKIQLKRRRELWRKRYCEKMVPRPKNPEAQAEKLGLMSDDMMHVFTWSNTPQGDAYWAEVRMNLSNLATMAKYRDEIY